MGLGGALGIAANALNVFSAGIQVTGQNIANANTPGYIREQLQVTPGPSYGVPPLILGTGVLATGVTQQVNQFLQKQLLSANSDSSGADALNSIYTTLQQQLQALGDNNLSTQVNSFVGSLNALANQPESVPLRQQVLDQGQQLATVITSLRASIDQQRRTQNVNVDQLVTKANGLIADIAQLNPQITKLEASGLLQSQAGSLRDQRYQDLNQLAQILPVTYQERSNGTVDVFTGSDYLVLGDTKQQLETVASGSAGVGIENVKLSITGAPITADTPGSGQLRGVLRGRDTVLGGFVQNLDTLTTNLIGGFNSIYASGQGLDGFPSTTSADAVDDSNVPLNQAGLAYSPESGSFLVNVTNKNTGITTTSTISVSLAGSPGDTTLNSLAGALGGVANVSATVTADGHLQIDAAANFEFQFAHDTSGALASLGINTFFTGNDSATIGINSALANNPNLLAAGQGGGPADGTNALALSQVAATPMAALDGLSINGFYNFVITDIGNKAQSETTLSKSFDDFTQSLTTQQQQFSGVSLDEEAINLMQYQQSYQAAARIVTTVNQLFQTLLQI